MLKNMKKILLVFACVAFVSCNKSFNSEELKQLNGYWEIKLAEMPDGTKKEYTVNPTIDYFELKGNKGFRKKVMPQFDGTYRVNDLSEDISVVNEDGKTYLSYKTEYAEWKEQILELDNENLVLKNEQDIEYHYVKPEPFTLK
tara:strand:- start:37191 stop:37619 length:429 start_codon:yes stop_codon:yes gene_type:complete